MLWIPINYWPAMRTAFEIILALPALLFAAALWIGWRHRRSMREAKLFEPLISANKNLNPDAAVKPPGLDSDPISVQLAVKPSLSESEFESALIQVEQLRATGDHAAAEQMLASLHGQAPV